VWFDYQVHNKKETKKNFKVKLHEKTNFANEAVRGVQ
jgi:hypothetical protein